MENNVIGFNVGVVLPAGGTGNRMCISQPKQYRMVLGKPLIYYTIESFHRLTWIQYIIVTVAHSSLAWMEEFVQSENFSKVRVTIGADTRHQSIYNGVQFVKSVCKEPDVLLIHDAVRIFVPEEIVKKIVVTAKLHGAAGVTRPLVSTVIAVGADSSLTQSLDRNLYRGSEMPQAFQYNIIKHAYDQSTSDDLLYGTECLLLAMKYSNVKAHLIEGDSTLWKVTHKKDLYAVEGMLKEKLNQTYLVNVKTDTELCSRFQKQFTDKHLKIEICPTEDVQFDCSLSYNLIHFTDTNTCIIENIIASYLNKTSSLHSHVKIIVVVCEVANKEVLLQTYPVLSEQCRTQARVLLQDRRIIMNLILTTGNNMDNIVSCCVDLVWNRSESLNGQTLILYE